jgi:hypothetical protein
MQQANLAEQSTVDTHGTSLPGSAPLNAFVINLCSSTSPVALTPPDHAGLKRFSFFVSRRREESRERFRLHMGYFDTQEEAEKLLDVVREIYPGAWAGLAPGHRLRAAAAQALAGTTATVAPEVAPAQLDQPLDVTPAAAAPACTTAAPAVPIAARQAQVSPAVEVEPAAVAVPADPATNAAAFSLVPDEGRRLPEGPGFKAEHAAARSLNDVRAAIASLEDTSERAPVLRPIPQLQPAASASTGISPARGSCSPKENAAEISDRGVLQVLEHSANAVGASATAATAATGTTAAMATPMAVARPGARAWQPPAQDETQPRTDKPCYAVQLMWSVQPMDIAQVPQLAIFSAYTLYGAEGNRDGRRWYGLRLGFFTDAVSAKQVAHYVRSEFSTVSVVPVTVRERERAKLAATRPALSAPAPAAAAAAPGTPKAEFEFIEGRELALPQRAKTGPLPARGAPGKRAKLRTHSAVHGRSKNKPLSLEETLEILGAGELQMDDGRAPLINEPSAAHATPKPAKNKASRLGRLFERLSERIGS